MKQQLRAKEPPEERVARHRYTVLQRPVSHAVRLTRQHAPLAQQVRGWSIVVGIVLTAVACWGLLILGAVILYRQL